MNGIEKKIKDALRDLNDVCLSYYLVEGLGCRKCPLDKYRWDDGEEWHCFVADAMNDIDTDAYTIIMEDMT